MKQSHWTLSLLTALGATIGVQEAQKGGLQSQVEELQGRVDGVEAYLKSQAKAHEALAKSVRAARDGGFTAGINPGSREALLEGLGGLAEAGQAKVPGRAEPAPEKPRSMRGIRRKDAK